jgi:hypothetical protein
MSCVLNDIHDRKCIDALLLCTEFCFKSLSISIILLFQFRGKLAACFMGISAFSVWNFT